MSGSASYPLRVDDLRVSFPVRSGLFGRASVTVVDGISFAVADGETLALVGESGSGKSTTARALLRLIDADSGSIQLAGTELRGLSRRSLRPLRRHAQMVFQDPLSSLDPMMTIAESVAEPLDVHRRDLGRAGRSAMIHGLLERVGLPVSFASRYPAELSGGQRQRVAIARAIAPEPKVLVCDEAVSALDVSTRNQIINLLEDLQRDLGMAILFIAHDLSVVRHIAHRVAVMYLGWLVEEGPVERIFRHPAHPYTAALLSAIPVPDPRERGSRDRIRLVGDVPDPSRRPSGCPFRTRCPHVMPVCETDEPLARDTTGGGVVRCHLHDHGPMLRGGPVTEVPMPGAEFGPTEVKR